MEEWQAIATAPKDGTPVRVLAPDPSNTFTKRYEGPAYWTGRCWWKLHRHGFFNMVAHPTHWKPLPMKE